MTNRYDFRACIGAPEEGKERLAHISNCTHSGGADHA